MARQNEEKEVQKTGLRSSEVDHAIGITPGTDMDATQQQPNPTTPEGNPPDTGGARGSGRNDVGMRGSEDEGTGANRVHVDLINCDVCREQTQVSPTYQ